MQRMLCKLAALAAKQPVLVHDVRNSISLICDEGFMRFCAILCDCHHLLMRIYANVCECMRNNANLCDQTKCKWYLCSSCIESHRTRRQDVCCTGTGKPLPIQHRPLFAFGSTVSCSARPTAAAASKSEKKQLERKPCQSTPEDIYRNAHRDREYTLELYKKILTKVVRKMQENS